MFVFACTKEEIQPDPPTEIETYGIFTGGTGRFEGATGTYLWEGLFIGTLKPNPADPPDTGTAFGTGEVKVTGEIFQGIVLFTDKELLTSFCSIRIMWKHSSVLTLTTTNKVP